MNTQSGFTLIEALAASLISTIVAGAVLSVLYMSNGQILDGSAGMRLTQLQAVASEQIRINARKAFGVKRAADGPGPLATAAFDPAFPNLKEVYFCNPAGDTLSGYRLDAGGVLMEWKNTGSGFGFYPFDVGEDTVKIDYAASDFAILPRRRGVTFNIKYLREQGGKSYSFPLIRERVLCRNTSL